MNFIPYLFKKDLFRLKFVFIAWFFLIAAQIALAVFSDKIMSEVLQAQLIVPVSARLINFLQCMMIMAIVPLIIQNDSLVGTTAFWFTRPISSKGLLITKSCLIFLVLIVVQLIAELIVLAVNGATSHYLLLAIPEVLIWDIAFIVPFFILASVTQKFSRYALAGIIVFAIFVVFLIIWTLASMYLVKHLPYLYKLLCGNLTQSTSMELSGKVVRRIYIILAGLGIVTFQFLTRRTARTVILVVIAFIGIMLVMRFWKYDFLQQPTIANNTIASSTPLTIRMDANYVSIVEEPRFMKKDDRTKSVSSKMDITGLPACEFAILQGITDANMIYPDGKSLKSKFFTNIQDTAAYSNEEFMQPIQSALPDIKLLNPYKDFFFSKVFSVDESEFHKYMDKKGEYTSKANFDIYQYKITSRIPVKIGAKSLFAAKQVLIYDIIKRPNAVSLIIDEKKINLIFDTSVKKTSMTDIAQDMYSDYDHIYLIVNAKRHEAFLPEASMNLFADVMEIYSMPRLKTSASKYDFTNLNNRNGTLPEIDDQWLADAELVRLDAQKIRKENINIKIPDFSIPAQSKGEKTDENELQKALKRQQQYQK